MAQAAVEEGSFTWRIDNWSSKAEGPRLNSEPFTIAGKLWRLQMYPQGQSNQGTHLSVFLDSSPERPANLEGLQKCEFTFTLKAAWDAADGSGSGDVVKDTVHRFRPTARSWGFSEFLELPELNDAARGFIFDDDSVTLSVTAEVHTALRAQLPPPSPTPAALLGFEPELFAQQPVAEMVLCGVCLSVMNDPVSCQEGHNFCRACLSAWVARSHARSCPLRCRTRIERIVPNRFAAELIGAMTLRCPAFAAAGATAPCAWIGSVRELARHRLTCTSAPQCPNAGCGACTAAGAMAAHRAACAFEIVSCSVAGCGATMLRSAVDEHMAAAAGAHVTLLDGVVRALTARLEEADQELRNVRQRRDDEAYR